MIVGNLVIEMAMNVARLQTDVEKANTLIGDHVRNVEKSINQVRNVLGSLGIGLSVAGLVAGIKSSLDFADRLNDLSKSTNLTVRELSGLDLAARQSGTDLEGAAKAVDKLSVNMGKNAKAFADLGINSTDKLTAFKQFADVFNQIGDIHQRDAFAAAALGKGWESTAALLAEGGNKIGAMVEKGQALSGITEENTRRADELNDKLDELSVTFRSFGLTIFDTVIPPLAKFNDWIADITIGVWEMAQKVGLAWELLSTPSAWFNDKELANLEARFTNIGRLADEARALNKAETHQGAASTAARKSGKGPDVSAFTNPEDAKAAEKQEKITQDALTQIKVDAFNQRIADRDAYNNAETQLYVDEFNAKIEQEQAMEDALTQIKVDAFNQRIALQEENQRMGKAFFTQDLSTLGKQNAAFLALYKVAAVAEIMAAGGVRAEKSAAWAATWGGPIAASAAFAVSWAATLANAAMVSGLVGGGGGGGAGSGVSAGPGAGGGTTTYPYIPEPTPVQATSVTINMGDGLYSANAVRDLIDKINEQVRDGAVIRNIAVA